MFNSKRKKTFVVNVGHFFFHFLHKKCDMKSAALVLILGCNEQVNEHLVDDILCFESSHTILLMKKLINV